MRKRAMILCLLICMALLWPVDAQAADENANKGYPADSLVINVGYFGGPYYEKKTFSLSELWNMRLVKADYTFIDSMPSVVIDHVVGVRLVDLMDAAGIDLNSVQTFYFWTNDKTSNYYTSYSKASLVDTPRYCYYSLPDNFQPGETSDYAASDKAPADTVLALADDWNRCIQGATFGSDYLNLDTSTRFRLIFGQANAYECTAARSAMWVHAINVELGGAPVLTLKDSNLEGEVGSVLRTEAFVQADSAVKGHESVTWSSSDENVATVDENGAITVKGTGTAVITAEFAGVTAELVVNGGAGAEIGVGDEGSGSNAGALKETDRPGTILEVRQPKVDAEGKSGGVQNWRVYEMSETAEALTESKPDHFWLGVSGAAVAGLLLISFFGYILLFRRSVG